MENGAVEQEMRSITETLRATGLPPTPEPEEHAEYANPDRIAQETTSAIERVCEAAIAGFYSVAEEAEKRAAEVRRVSDQFAEKLRAVSKGHAQEVANLLVFCRQAQTAMEQHASEFEAKVKNGSH